MSVWLTAGIAAVSLGQTGNLGRLDAIDSGDKAWAMGQPRVIAHNVEQFSWTPDGAHIFYTTRVSGDAYTLPDLQQRLYQSTSELWAFSTLNLRGSRVAKFPQGSMPEFPEWLNGSSVALLKVVSPGFDPATREPTVTRTLYAVNASPPSHQILLQSRDDSDIYLMMPPNKPKALLSVGIKGGPESQYFLFEAPTGMVEMVNPPPALGGWQPWGWLDDEHITWHRFNNGSSDYMRHNPGTGEQTPISEDAQKHPAPPAGAKPSPPFLMLNSASVQVAREFGNPMSHTFFLMAKPEGDSPMAIVTASAEQAALHPKKESVAFVSDGTLYYREIKEIDRSILLQQLEQQEQMQLVMRAKQVGLALFMFAADNNDALPIGNIEGSIQPYLKNREITAGFVFSLPQGSLVDVERPAETPIGHLDGKYGRATVYADGHVYWTSSRGGQQ